MENNFPGQDYCIPIQSVSISLKKKVPFYRGSKSALSRIAYEFCEDSAKQNIRYSEVRYCPHLLSDSVDNPEYAKVKGNFTPRDAVVAINEGLSKGMKDFGVKVYSILCCMTHRPGKFIFILVKIIDCGYSLGQHHLCLGQK